MGDDLRAQRADHALKEEEMQQAAEEERLRLEIELQRTRETQTLQLKHKEQALAEMSEKLRMLNDSLRSAQEVRAPPTPVPGDERADARPTQLWL